MSSTFFVYNFPKVKSHDNISVVPHIFVEEKAKYEMDFVDLV